jgi:hypothetical protein
MFPQIPLPEIKTEHDLIYGLMHISDVVNGYQETLPVSYYRVIDASKTVPTKELRQPLDKF